LSKRAKNGGGEGKEINNQTRPIAIIVLGSSDAKADVVKLLSFVEDNFSLKQ